MNDERTCAPHPEAPMCSYESALGSALAALVRIRALLEDPNHSNMILTETLRAALAPEADLAARELAEAEAVEQQLARSAAALGELLAFARMRVADARIKAGSDL